MANRNQSSAVDPWMQEIGGDGNAPADAGEGGFNPSPVSTRSGLGQIRGGSTIEDEARPGFTIATGDPDDSFTAWEQDYRNSSGGHGAGSGLHLARWRDATKRWARGSGGSSEGIHSLNLGTPIDPTQVADPRHRGVGTATPLGSASSKQPWTGGGSPLVGSGQWDRQQYPQWGDEYNIAGAAAPGGVAALAESAGGSSPPRLLPGITPGAPGPGAFPGSTGAYGGLPVQQGPASSVEVTGGKMGNRNNPINALVEKVRSYTNSYQDHWNNTATAGGLFGSINVPRPSDFLKISGSLKTPHAYVDTRYLTGAAKPWLDLSKEEWMPSETHKPF